MGLLVSASGLSEKVQNFSKLPTSDFSEVLIQTLGQHVKNVQTTGTGSGEGGHIAEQLALRK